MNLLRYDAGKLVMLRRHGDMQWILISQFVLARKIITGIIIITIINVRGYYECT